MFGLFKGLNSKKLKFAVKAYLNPAYKKAAEITLGRSIDLIELSKLRDEVDKCVDFTYSINLQYLDGSDDGVRAQSHFIAMLCLLNSLTKTSFPEDGFLKEVTIFALGILGYEVENNIVKLDYPNHKDKAIYEQCVAYLNNREITPAEKEIEEFILNDRIDEVVEAKSYCNEVLSVEKYLEKYINPNTSEKLMHGNTRQFYIHWLMSSSALELNTALKNNHSYLQALYCIIRAISSEKNNNNDDSRIFILSFLAEIKLTMLRDGKNIPFIDDNKDFFTEIYNTSVNEIKLLDVAENINYDEWFDLLKKEAVNHHNQLFISDDGISYFDLLGKTNFKLAYDDKINPKILAKEFADTLDDDFSIVEDMIQKGLR
ncbi:hypothetical protein FCU45_09505 [Sulfurimonas crateris]|uniref:Uncharacterized protein n=1 Tax=Sulfurimonas crateris TaxID=2574727 RepID=A0A4U2Z3G6_9BACT|nr:hypothetical protein [Sulfurimonas crateris]TKI68648.1 hypothetical protein FCU45_09505 [Sulfurimonas crateris]